MRTALLLAALTFGACGARRPPAVETSRQIPILVSRPGPDTPIAGAPEPPMLERLRVVDGLTVVERQGVGELCLIARYVRPGHEPYVTTSYVDNGLLVRMEGWRYDDPRSAVPAPDYVSRSSWRNGHIVADEVRGSGSDLFTSYEYEDHGLLARRTTTVQIGGHSKTSVTTMTWTVAGPAVAPPHWVFFASQCEDACLPLALPFKASVEVDADGRRKSYEYDDHGRLVLEGTIYDGRGRPTRWGTEEWRWEEDRLVERKYSGQVDAYEFDGNDRVTRLRHFVETTVGLTLGFETRVDYLCSSSLFRSDAP